MNQAVLCASSLHLNQFRVFSTKVQHGKTHQEIEKHTYIHMCDLRHLYLHFLASVLIFCVLLASLDLLLEEAGSDCHFRNGSEGWSAGEAPTSGSLQLLSPMVGGLEAKVYRGHRHVSFGVHVIGLAIGFGDGCRSC